MSETTESANRMGVFEWKGVFVEKWLFPDGSIVLSDGTIVEEADSHRAEIWAQRDAIVAKFQLPDGSVTYALPGGEGNGGTINHKLLINRDADDQHPILAITGLNVQLSSLGKQAATNASNIENLTYDIDIVDGGTF